ncbi:MAG: hypothetical protein HY000_11160, partial [Planctomycetes bacterium]|nr:hypothetical protein [Planctomycetota bacterium]
AAIGIALAVGRIVWAEGAAQEKIYCRQKAFKIPFQIRDPAEQKQLQEVQLYVARNGGRWEKYTAAPPDVPPEKRSFTFRADQDGEFWFAIRTLDKHGAYNPEDEAQLQADLRVVVDSEIPRIELRPIPGNGREVGVEWDIQDRNLDLDSLKLEYRVEGQDTSQPVPGVVPKFIGRVTWIPDAPGRVTVRCQVQDRAKNQGIVSVDVEPGAAPSRSAPGSVEGPPTNSGATREKPAWPLENVPPRAGASQSYSNTNTGRDGPAESFQSPSGPSFSPGSSTHPAEDRTRSTAPATGGSGPRSSNEGAGAPADRHLMRDADLSLEYQIDDQGPSGVSVVELWVTKDGGHTWQLQCEDKHPQSPLHTRLDGEGVYGLTLVAKNGLGVGERPPVSNDPPQTWVEIDTTPPQVRLFTPEIGKGPDLGSLIITWKAEDPNLGEHCVSLFYDEGFQGNWKPIATGIDNTGRYVWKLDSQVPPRFRVVIKVADQAGNFEIVKSDEVTDNSKPRPRIQAISPTGNSRK